MAGVFTLAISSSVEVIKYADGLGLGELDDFFNNVLGACLGIGAYKLQVQCCNEEN